MPAAQAAKAEGIVYPRGKTRGRGSRMFARLNATLLLFPHSAGSSCQCWRGRRWTDSWTVPKHNCLLNSVVPERNSSPCKTYCIHVQQNSNQNTIWSHHKNVCGLYNWSCGLFGLRRILSVCSLSRNWRRPVSIFRLSQTLRVCWGAGVPAWRRNRRRIRKRLRWRLLTSYNMVFNEKKPTRRCNRRLWPCFLWGCSFIRQQRFVLASCRVNWENAPWERMFWRRRWPRRSCSS